MVELDVPQEVRLTQPSSQEQKPPGDEGFDVEVLVDGRAVGINPFVRKLVGSVVMSIVSTLYGGESTHTVQITLRCKQREKA